MKKLTKKQKKKFKKQLEETMGIIRGSYQKVVNFSTKQSKNKMWEELK